MKNSFLIQNKKIHHFLVNYWVVGQRIFFLRVRIDYAAPIVWCRFLRACKLFILFLYTLQSLCDCSWYKGCTILQWSHCIWVGDLINLYASGNWPKVVIIVKAWLLYVFSFAIVFGVWREVFFRLLTFINRDFNIVSQYRGLYDSYIWCIIKSFMPEFYLQVLLMRYVSLLFPLTNIALPTTDQVSRTKWVLILVADLIWLFPCFNILNSEWL